MRVSQGRPKVTAWLDSGFGTGGQDLDEPRLYVAIAYQWGKACEEIDEREVHVVIFYQEYPDDYDDWWTSGDIRVAPNDEDWAVHPDIVYGAYIGKYENGDLNPNFEALVITYEEIDTYSWQRAIYLGELHEYYGWNGSWEIDDEYFYSWGNPIWVPFYPRIDIGLDSSDAWGDDYYIAVVVFNWVTPVDGDFLVNLMPAWKCYNVPTDFEAWTTYPIDYQSGPEIKNALPYVEIDPLENYLEFERMNYTHVVWSRLRDEDGNTIQPYYTNSYEQHTVTQDGTGDIIPITDYVYQQRVGLPTITTYVNQDPDERVGTVQYISEDNNDQYPVYSCVVYYAGGNEDYTNFDDHDQISSGYSDDDFPWTLGPASALWGDEGNTVCAWTEYVANYPPDIYGDFD